MYLCVHLQSPILMLQVFEQSQIVKWWNTTQMKKWGPWTKQPGRNSLCYTAKSQPQVSWVQIFKVLVDQKKKKRIQKFLFSISNNLFRSYQHEEKYIDIIGQKGGDFCRPLYLQTVETVSLESAAALSVKGSHQKPGFNIQECLTASKKDYDRQI